MAVTDQTWTRFANNKFVLEWAGILDVDAGDGSIIDLTGRVVKFSLSRFSGGEPIRTDPLLDFSSDDASPRVVIPNPTTGNPHVRVTVEEEDTSELAPKTTDFYVELEVFDAGSTDPVVVATGTLTLKPNVDNS